MRIGDFQQIAQTEDKGRIVQDSNSGELKTSSFKGKVLSHLKGEAKERNEKVKDAFIKSIRDTYGNDAAESARKMIGTEGKALTVRDVRAVLDKHMTIHRTHGESAGITAVRPEVGRFIEIINGSINKETIQNAFDSMSGDEKNSIASVLSSASMEQIVPAIQAKFPQATEAQASDVARWMLETTGGDPDRVNTAFQPGDLQPILIRAFEGGYGLDVEMQDTGITPELMNKIVMATDDELARAIKTVEPSRSDSEVAGDIKTIRENSPRITLGDSSNPSNLLRGNTLSSGDSSEARELESAVIGGTTFIHDRKLGEGGFGEAHLLVSADGSEKLVVKRMLMEETGTEDFEAVLNEKNAEARSEVRAHDFIMAEGSDTTNIAKIKTALAGPDGTISIALEACELGDTARFFGGLGTVSAIDQAEANTSGAGPSLNSSDAALIKRMVALDIASGMRVMQEDCQMLHLDMKPGNVFLSGDGILKIGDFGLGKETPRFELPKGFTTTPVYRAPETKAGNIVTTKSDCFTLGVMIYQLETGMVPFYDDDTTGFGSVIERAQDDWFAAEAGHIGLADGKYATGNSDLDDIVNALTNPDPEKRVSIGEALEMPYFKTFRQISDTQLTQLRQALVSIA